MSPCAQNNQKVGLWRRLAAISYDCLLVLAFYLISTAFIVALLPEHVIPPGNRLYQLYLLLVLFGFFGWFWTHGGQTLGMLAWRIRIETRDGKPLTFKHALLRFVLAFPALLCGAVGLLWLLFDKERLALHDRWSNTRLVLSPKPGSC